MEDFGDDIPIGCGTDRLADLGGDVLVRPPFGGIPGDVRRSHKRLSAASFRPGLLHGLPRVNEDALGKALTVKGSMFMVEVTGH